MTTLLRFLFSAIGLLVACAFVPGLGHGSFLDLLIVAVILAALNETAGKDRPWHFRVRGRNLSVMPSSRVYVDGGDAIVRAAVLGMGIGQVPHYMVSESIARGELVELLPTMRPPAMPIAAVIPSARMVPSRVRALLELLKDSADAFPLPPPVGVTPTKRKRRRTAA